MMTSEPDYLARLNPEQRSAVETIDGAVLVLAGAGTGKTRVLTTRLAHILSQGRARPYNIMAVTFTNKAAREMGERLNHLMGGPVEGIWLGTFHALAARILRRHAELVGLKSNFTILDEDDQLRLIKQLLQANNIADDKTPAKMLLAIIQRWKDRALTPDKISAAEAGEIIGGKLIMLYAQYQQRLATLNCADFGDLLLHNITIFQKHPAVLQNYQQLLHYILVDEYQDTNVAQYLWLRLLAQGHRNICCVGDDDQSIYSWLGAEVGNILRFEKDFPGAKIIRLERNYRSTGNILAAASAVIANNQGRLGKTLWTEGEKGAPVTVRGLWDGPQEAIFVGDEIEAAQRRDVPLHDMAILVRTGAQTREFEERLLQLGIPYRVVGGLRFYERQEIRDAIAYLRVIATPEDSLAFERIINVPRRGIGETTIRQLHEYSRQHQIPLTEAAWRLTETDEIRGQARKNIRDLLENFARWRSQSQTLPQGELAQIVLEESGYTSMWQQDKSPEAPGRLDNLKELVAAMEEYENLEGFLEHVALVMENNEKSNGSQISLMSLHAAKGLEFSHVFLPGWEEGLFPHQRSLDESGVSGLEEERRLAYVGITRAKHRAFISYAANRRIYNQWQSATPSRFLQELPAANIDRVVERGLNPQPQPQFQREAEDWKPRRIPSGGLVIEGKARVVATGSVAASKGGYKPGQRVFHQKFGYGKIRAIDHDKLEIDFEKAGRKKVVDSFVSAA
ncbi:MAG: ATP-dependent helicase [Dongiaceae bacterium]